jgi:hypothetical protein
MTRALTVRIGEIDIIDQDTPGILHKTTIERLIKKRADMKELLIKTQTDESFYGLNFNVQSEINDTEDELVHWVKSFITDSMILDALDEAEERDIGLGALFG